MPWATRSSLVATLRGGCTRDLLRCLPAWRTLWSCLPAGVCSLWHEQKQGYKERRMKSSCDRMDLLSEGICGTGRKISRICYSRDSFLNFSQDSRYIFNYFLSRKLSHTEQELLARCMYMFWSRVWVFFSTHMPWMCFCDVVLRTPEAHPDISSCTPSPVAGVWVPLSFSGQRYSDFWGRLFCSSPYS